MFLISINKPRRLLCLNYVGRVTPAELKDAREELQTFLADMPPDFRLLADLSQLDHMDPACAAEMGNAMELLDKHGVGLLVRVIPDTSKDIGLSILTIFHYARQPRIITCQTMAQALHQLALLP